MAIYVAFAPALYLAVQATASPYVACCGGPELRGLREEQEGNVGQVTSLLMSMPRVAIYATESLESLVK